MTIGEMIKTKRKELNLTQEELGKRIHVSRQTISSWENSKSLPDMTSLLLLSEAYDISLDELIKENISVIKKIEINERKEKLKTSFLISLILDGLLFLLATILWLTEYENDFIYALIIFILLVNAIPVACGLGSYLEVTQKNKK